MAAASTGGSAFELASMAINDKLGISLGAAQRTLRELCGSGDVRSIRFASGGMEAGKPREETEPQFIKPSEWLKDELVDFRRPSTAFLIMLR